MKILIFGITLFGINSVIAQTSVYDCQSNSAVTPAVINAAGSVFQQQCVEFPDNQTFLFNNTFNKEVQANTEIRIEPGFTAGSFTSSGGMKLSVTAKSDFDVAVMNYPDLMNVLKLEKLEFGVKLPSELQTKVNNFVQKVPNSTQVNPFLVWQLDVEATFTHSTSGTTKKIDAFYYREYQRDLTNQEWDEIQTPYSMRVRFSPPEAGKWLCTISIKVNNVQTYISAPFTFQVTNSTNPGYVTVHPNNRNLQQNGRMIFPVGINFDGPVKNVINNHSGPYGMPDVFDPEDIDFTTTPDNFITYHNDIIAYKNLGGKFIRTLQNPWGALIEFTEKGNYYNRLHYAWEQDRLIDYCEANDILIHFNLMHQEPFMKYGNYHFYDWDWSHYREDGSYFEEDIFPAYCYANGNQKEPYEMFLNEDDLKYHEQRTRYYISRYGYSTSIYLFELLSEPWHVNEISGQTEPFQQSTTLGESVRAAVKNYHERISTYIKQSLGHTEHLVGIDVFTATIFNSPNFLDQSISHPDIDIISFNPYSGDPTKLVIGKHQNLAETEDFIFSDEENSMYKAINTIQNVANKPVIIAEGGPGDGVDDCSNFAQQNVDMMSFGFTGVAGFNSWIGGFLNQEVTWQTIVNAQNHMNGYDVIDVLMNGWGNWKQGREIQLYANFQNKETKELQYYISSDMTIGAGYVKNRTFNAYTARSSDDPSSKCMLLGTTMNQDLKDYRNLKWDEKTVTVQGLKLNTNYMVHWFEFKTGTYLGTGCESTTNSTKIPLVHPQLYVHPDAVNETGHLWPVLWFIIEENNCNNLATTSLIPNSQISYLPTETTLEVVDDSKTTTFIVAPNPFQENLTLSGLLPIGHIKLINNLNQIIFETTTEENELLINTSHYKRGAYQLIMVDSGIVFKITKL